MEKFTDTQEQFQYFQFQKELGLPIYLRVNLTQFDENLLKAILDMQFFELSASEIKNIDTILNTNKASRLLTISEVSFSVSRQINSHAESDRFGPESITSHMGHQVYRFKSHALMIYASYAKEWKLGVFSSFGAKSDELEFFSIMNRFLSWSLAPLSIVGFWGVPVDEGVVVLKQSLSRGEAIFIDVQRNTILSVEGERKIGAKFSILKLSETLRGKNIKMTREELFSFLSTFCTYFDSNGQSVPVRQMILKISKNYQGLIHPSESFRPRTDLSI